MSLPQCTAAAVTKVLAAGFTVSEPDGPGLHDRSAGVYAFDLPLSRPQVAVYCWPRSAAFPQREAVTCALGAAGHVRPRPPAAEPERLMSGYDEFWPDGMQPETGEECFACGAPCGGRGGPLCDPRCASCNPDADGRSS